MFVSFLFFILAISKQRYKKNPKRLHEIERFKAVIKQQVKTLLVMLSEQLVYISTGSQLQEPGLHSIGAKIKLKEKYQHNKVVILDRCMCIKIYDDGKCLCQKHWIKQHTCSFMFTENTTGEIFTVNKKRKTIDF